MRLRRRDFGSVLPMAPSSASVLTLSLYHEKFGKIGHAENFFAVRGNTVPGSGDGEKGRRRVVRNNGATRDARHAARKIRQKSGKPGKSAGKKKAKKKGKSRAERGGGMRDESGAE